MIKDRISSREEALFSEALALPASERAVFVERACAGDAPLRARITALLALSDGTGSLPVDAAARLAVRQDEATADVIDRYKLLQKVGEGGCGVVWLAEQEEPVRRRVALKVIKLGMDTKAVIARFEAERQALARMDHPHIAKVLDAGATRSGRPFFVMELVRGIPITRFCDEHQLTPRERLRLFVQVCHAVQHAHQKGIIHRDLKPSNILVTAGEEGPTPKVIDFGIAKATQGRLTDATLFTAFDQFIGTPIYMSPEQAEMSSLDVDTRTDIYSLGVLLYELLTGRPPFDPATFAQAGIDGMRRQIRESEPPRPSARLRSLGDEERLDVARRRRVGAGQLSLLLRGDLDWIVMRCIEKNRTRRYETANALAADITRHLQFETVLARPPGAAYRLGKLVRRNRLSFAAAAVVALALVAGTAVSLRQAVRATQAEQAAGVERAKAVEVRARADSLLTFMIGDLRHRLATVGRLDVLEGVGERAVAYFTSLAPTEVNETTAAGHANALTLIGDVRLDQGRYPEALQQFQESFARAAALTSSRPDSVAGLFARSQAEFGLGNVHWKRKEFGTAGEWFIRYRDSARTLATMEPENLVWQRELASGYSNLAAVAMELGEYETARDGFLGRLAVVERLMQARPQDLELRFQAANTASFLGTIAERDGDLAEAVRRHREEVRRYEEIVAIEPRTPRWRFKLAEALSFEADVLAVTGQPEQAVAALSRARPLFEAAVALDPTNVRWRIGLQIQELKEATHAAAAGDASGALQRVQASRAIWEQLAAAEPTDHRIAFRLAMAWRLEAHMGHLSGTGDPAAAAQRALELARKVIRDGADMPAELGELAQACIVAGRIAYARGDAAGAAGHWSEARQLVAPRRAAGTRHWRVLDPAARSAALLGRTDEAQAIVAELGGQGYVPLEPWRELGEHALAGTSAPGIPISL